MKFEIDRSEMLQILPGIAGIVDRRQTLPILNNLLVDATDGELCLTATDLELQITSRVSATVLEVGRATIPAKKLLDICRVLPDDSVIKLQVDGTRVIVQGSRSRFELASYPHEDYPSLESFEDAGISLELDAAIGLEMLEKTSLAMAFQDVRYYLNGLMMAVENSRLITVATDGHRLVKCDRECREVLGWEEGREYIFPSKTVLEMKKVFHRNSTRTARLNFGTRSVIVEIGDTVIRSKLIEGKYPDYKRVIPEGLESTVRINKGELRDVLTRTSVLCYDKQKAARFVFDKDELIIETTNPDGELAQEDVQVKFDGQKSAIAFNVGYWLDVLNVILGPEIMMRFTDSEKSALVMDSSREDEVFVLMPMKI